MIRSYQLNANEPVRLGFLVLGLLIGTSTFLLAWGSGQDWRLALGGALGQVVAALVGGEAVSAQTYGPQSVDELITAEQVIHGDPVAVAEHTVLPAVDAAPDDV